MQPLNCPQETDGASCLVVTALAAEDINIILKCAASMKVTTLIQVRELCPGVFRYAILFSLIESIFTVFKRTCNNNLVVCIRSCRVTISFIKHGCLFHTIELRIELIEVEMGAEVSMAFASSHEEISAHLHSTRRYRL